MALAKELIIKLLIMDKSMIKMQLLVYPEEWLDWKEIAPRFQTRIKTDKEVSNSIKLVRMDYNLLECQQESEVLDQ